MTPKTFWAITVPSMILFIAVADLWIFFKFGTPSTLSALIRDLDQVCPFVAPILAFTAGALYGHFFIPLKPRD